MSKEELIHLYPIMPEDTFYMTIGAVALILMLLLTALILLIYSKDVYAFYKITLLMALPLILLSFGMDIFSNANKFVAHGKEVANWKETHFSKYLETSPISSSEIVNPIRIHPSVESAIKGNVFYISTENRYLSLVSITFLKEEEYTTVTGEFVIREDKDIEEKPYLTYTFVDGLEQYGIKDGIYNPIVYVPPGYNFAQ